MFSLPRRRFAISGALVAFVVAFLAIPAAQASADLIVNLNGTGAGAVTSSPAGIECSNVGGGAPGPSCDASFGGTPVQLTAAPSNDSYFIGWAGDDPFAGAFGLPTCNEGLANPCGTVDPEGFGIPLDVHITATFDLLPNPPAVTTGGAAPGAEDWLRTLEGTVDPEEFKVDDCHFEYGATTEYGETTPCVEPDASELDETSTTPEPVLAETEPLEPEATYHYRLVASNIGGTGKGEDRTFTTAPAPPDSCPNAQSRERRAEQGIAALLLPDCMALEMVSPTQKSGYPARSPTVSADGSRVSFLSAAVLGEDPPGLVNVTATYVASRGGSGWASEMTLPRVDPRFHAQWNLSSESHPSFTPDFSRWFGIGASEVQLQQGIDLAYEGGLDRFFRPLSEPLVPLSFELGTAHSYQIVKASQFKGASADHSHLYFQPGVRATYLSGDPSLAGPGAEPGNVYLARSGASGQPAQLELLNRDRTGEVWGGNCGARLGGIGSVLNSELPAPNGERNQGAVSADGSRTYFSARASQPQSGNCEASSKLRILQRLETPSGPQITPLFSSECSRPSLPDPPGPCKELSGDDLYQGASLDQSKVYFTTNRELANSDLDGSNAECGVLAAVPGCDLYLYDSSRPTAHRLVQVSAGEDLPSEASPTVHERGKEADVYNGITAISADGSHVYFVAAGVLTDNPNPAGDIAQPGEPNLYIWDAESEETAFLGTLAPNLGPSERGDAIVFSDEGNGLWGGQGTWLNNAYPVPVLSPAEQGGQRGEEGGDGHVLVFESRAELTANDADGRHRDVYRYDADAETLECLSCAPGSSASEPDEAPFDVDNRGESGPLGTDFAESHRWVSEDGQESAFITPQALLPGDVDGAKDAYLWRQGSLVRLPGKPFVGFQSGTGPLLSHDGSTVAFATGTPLLPQDRDKPADVYVARVDGGFPNPPVPEPCEPGNPDPSKRCQPPEPPPPTPLTASEALGSGNPPPQPRRCGKGKVRRHGRCVPRHRHRHAGKRRHTRQTDTHRRAGK